jgi:hypothetical protein
MGIYINYFLVDISIGCLGIDMVAFLVCIYITTLVGMYLIAFIVIYIATFPIAIYVPN